MYMAIGLIAFLLTGFFVVKGIIDLLRKKNFKKSFLIALGSFLLFVAAVSLDPSPSTEVAIEEKLQNEAKENKEESNKEKAADEEKNIEEKAENTAEKEETKKEEASKEDSAGEKKDVALAPKMTNRGVDAKVVRVVDGDTFEVMMNGKIEDIRMLLLDTPETKHPSKPVEPFGTEASNFAKEMLQGKTVGIEAGIEERDHYGRVLAYVWIGNKTYQEMALERGLGVTAYLYNDLRMLEPFHKAQNIARNKKIGVWSIPGYAHVDHNHGYHYEEQKTAASTPAAKPAAQPVAKPAPQAAPTPAPAQPAQSFANCTELRTVYPNGVDSSHPAYQKKMDRDGDNYACER